MVANEIMTNHDINIDEITTESLELNFKTNENDVEQIKKSFRQMNPVQLREAAAGILFRNYGDDDLIELLVAPERVIIKLKKERKKPTKSYGKFNFKDLEDIKIFLERVKSRSYKMYVYCFLGIELGLRSSDLLNINFKDIDDFIKGCKAKLSNRKNAFSIVDIKTNKPNHIYFNDDTLDLLEEYVERIRNNEIVDCSSVVLEECKLFIDLNYDSVIRFFMKLQKEYSEYTYIKGFRTHLLRRTCCYVDLIIKRIPLSKVMDKFNHSTQKQTLDYACITAEEYYQITGERL